MTFSKVATQEEIPLVSVAIATYNGEKFLRQQLDSIYDQTYKNIEVVVTDDCSTDKTIDILEEYKLKYGLKYFVNSRNLGVVKNFEKAMSLCQGKYIALADQDDVWKPEKIEILVNEIENYTLIYAPALEVIDVKGTVIYTHENTHLIEKFGTGKPTHRLIAFNWVVSHQVLFKKDLLNLALPIPINEAFHDAWLAIVATKLNGIKFLNKGLMYYRQHESSLTYPDYRISQSKGKIRRILSFFKPSQRSIRQKEIEKQIIRLNDIKNLAFFEENDKNFMQELVSYYLGQLEFCFHWRSAKLAIKYADLFFLNRNWPTKLKFIAVSLLG